MSHEVFQRRSRLTWITDLNKPGGGRAGKPFDSHQGVKEVRSALLIEAFDVQLFASSFYFTSLSGFEQRDCPMHHLGVRQH